MHWTAPLLPAPGSHPSLCVHELDYFRHLRQMEACSICPSVVGPFHVIQCLRTEYLRRHHSRPHANADCALESEHLLKFCTWGLYSRCPSPSSCPWLWEKQPLSVTVTKTIPGSTGAALGVAIYAGWGVRRDALCSCCVILRWVWLLPWASFSPRTHN